MAKTATKKTVARKRPARAAGRTFGEKGQAFWDEVLEKYDPSLAERRTLEDVCHEIDLIERLQTELAGADLVVSGSMGQDVSSPLVAALAQHRALLDRLLKSLKFTDDSPPDDGGERSSSARERAMRRWGRGA